LFVLSIFQLALGICCKDSVINFSLLLGFSVTVLYSVIFHLYLDVNSGHISGEESSHGDKKVLYCNCILVTFVDKTLWEFCTCKQVSALFKTPDMFIILQNLVLCMWNGSL